MAKLFPSKYTFEMREMRNLGKRGFPKTILSGEWINIDFDRQYKVNKDHGTFAIGNTQ